MALLTNFSQISNFSDSLYLKIIKKICDIFPSTEKFYPVIMVKQECPFTTYFLTVEVMPDFITRNIKKKAPDVHDQGKLIY